MGHLRQIQQQKLIQKLSPQQIQLMKLLQVPTTSILKRLQQELEENPALELTAETPTDTDPTNEFADQYADKDEYNQEASDERSELDDYLDMDVSDYLEKASDIDTRSSFSNYDNDDEEPVAPGIRLETTFHDHLADQMRLLRLTDKQVQIALQIIGSIDDDGYLRRELPSIVDDLAFTQNISTTEEEIKKILAIIQTFDPSGVGARDLQECLLIQLAHLPEDTDGVNVAIKILKDCFDPFTKKHYNRIKDKLKLTNKEFKSALSLILKLTPKPGASFTTGSQTPFYVIPDFFVYNKGGELELTLNSRNAPQLHISEDYKDMLETYDKKKKKTKGEKETLLFIKQKLDGAKWFIDAIRQRQHTLLETMTAILRYQKEFFLSGNVWELKPMILKDIADVVHLDISTISRVVNSKYVQTEFGIYLLKYFFSESMTTSSGREASTHEIKSILSDVVNSEDKHAPYSDEKLMEILAEKGYPVARRTIAKYRGQLKIPVARLRKEI